MKKYEEKLLAYIAENKVDCEHMCFDRIVHSVQDACDVTGAQPEDFIKSICLIDAQGRLIVPIVKGEDRASTGRVGKALNIERPRQATPQEVEERTGFIVGGVPGFAFEAIFLLDPKVLESEYIYTGGGSSQALTKISAKEILRVNGGEVVRVRK